MEVNIREIKEYIEGRLVVWSYESCKDNREEEIEGVLRKITTIYRV